jgi:ATP-dependent Clp protease adaptor protein ClpS
MGTISAGFSLNTRRRFWLGCHDSDRKSTKGFGHGSAEIITAAYSDYRQVIPITGIFQQVIPCAIHDSMSTLPATKPGTVLEQHTAHIPLYKVLLHNDDVNTMEHVIKALMQVFKFDRSRCEIIMMEAHREGVALCSVEPLEQAELHRDQLTAFSLVTTIERE